MVKKRNFTKSALFFLLILAIVFFCLFPFAQMLSLSLKYSWDWGNPSWIPSKVNVEAYKELLNIGSSLKQVPESVRQLLEESPDLTSAQKQAILSKYQSTGDVFPFLRYFANSLLVAFLASFILLQPACIPRTVDHPTRGAVCIYVRRNPFTDSSVPDIRSFRLAGHPGRHDCKPCHHIRGSDASRLLVYAGKLFPDHPLLD